jgi:hypothetical protein
MGFPDSGGYTPPDTVMAVGTNHIVEVINSTVAIYTKSGVNLSQMALDTFFNVPGQFLYDPVATYDEMTDRFLVGVIQLDDVAETSSFFLAVSNTGDPTAGFTQMQINLKETIGTTSYWADYPKVGWNADAYVFTFNMYSFPTSSAAFDHTQVLSVNKTTLATFRVDEPTGVFTMAAATMHGAAPGAPMYFVVGNTGGGATIDVITMTNVLSPTPTFATTTLAVNAYGAPPDAVQPGDVITTNDARMLNAEWRANRLVATHTVGAGGKAEVRWYDIDVTGAPTITQQGNVDQGAGVSTFMPAIAIAPDGSLGMSFMQCSATQFISIYVTVQTPTTPPGTMETPLLAQAGQATYTDFTGSPYRSGDYSGIGIDPVDGTFWGANEYATSAATNNWGTFIVNFGNPITPPPPGKNLIGRYLPQRWITELTDAGWVYTGNITIFNRTGKNISGPLEAAILNLPLGVTVENPSGYTSSGVPFLSLPGNGSLPNNEPIRLRIRLRNPFQLPLGTFYTGFLIQLVPLGS